jgi:hypothetical protein
MKGNGEPVKAVARSQARVTERDRQLIGVLATARYLSTVQIGKLFFLGRNPKLLGRRLLALAGEEPNRWTRLP